MAKTGVNDKRVCDIKADHTNRFLAKFIDFLIAAAVWQILPSQIGFLASVTYILIADGMPPRGQSFGKRFIGLYVVYNPSGDAPHPCDWKHSIIRNLPFVLFCLASVFGFLGVLFFVVGLVLIAFEAYFVYSDDQGIRLGDIFANTKVLNK